MTINKRMAAFRERHKLTTGLLAEYLGTNGGAVLRYEAGQNVPNPQTKLFEKLERVVERDDAIPTIAAWWAL